MWADAISAGIITPEYAAQKEGLAMALAVSEESEFETPDFIEAEKVEEKKTENKKEKELF